MTGMFLRTEVSSERTLGIHRRGLSGIRISTDTAPLPLEARKTAGEQLIIRFRGPEVIATVCLYDAFLDIFRVEQFRLIRCDEHTDILSKGITVGI